MSFPNRPPMVPGMPPMGMQFMGLPGMPPGMPVGIPPPLMGGPPPTGSGGNPMSYFPPPTGGNRQGMPGGPPPNMLPSNNNMNRSNRPHGHMNKLHNRDRDRDSQMNFPPSLLQPAPNLGPPVTVFVGNITEKWPDAMIRQLLATCGQVLNWKRVQGASGKLQGFGFCDFNGPDAGLRAVRLLHEQEVGDKKLVVKVDAKTSTVLDEFKNDRRQKKTEEVAKRNTEKENGELESAEDGEGVVKEAKDNSDNDNDGEIKEDEDYMDDEMKEADERSRARIAIIFREFKSELESYVPPGDKPDKDSGSTKVQMQDKLHLLKLSSLEKAGELADNEEFPEDLAMEEGKREIITREISNFRENMKQEKQKEEERKKHIRERREREKAREERRKEERERSPVERIRRDRSRSPGPGFRQNVPSPSRMQRSRSRTDDGRRDRNRDNRREREDRDNRDRGRDREQNQRDNRDKDRRRNRSRDRRSRSMSRDRSPAAPPKPRYREREEEEEAAEQKRIERRAREKEAAYEERLRVWETREGKKSKEIRREKDKIRRQDEDQLREAKRMKQFLEDYDDEKHDSKYYKGKELTRRLADRAKELEADNKDRQREREELEEIKLRMLTSNTPSPGGASLGTRFEKYKKPMSDTTNTSIGGISSYGKSFGLGKTDSATPISSRLQALAGGVTLPSKPTVVTLTSQNNGHSPATRHPVVETKKDSIPPVIPVETVKSTVPVPHASTQRTSFDSIQFKPFVPIKSSNPATPNSIPSSPAVPQMSPSVKSLAGTGFQLTLNTTVSKERDTKDTKEAVVNPITNDDSRTSFSPGGHSPGMASPGNSRDYDDFSMQGISPVDAPKKKRIDVKDVFNQDEDDDGLGTARKRKLVPLDFGDEAKKKRDDKIPEDRKKHIKSLIDKIPTDKEALFAHEIDWDMLDKSLMERRIRPWINKKIIDYIGEPEPTLVEFICSKVLGRSAPQSILDDVMMVLDDEAEVFVVKMWRLLVYEIAAKKYGIANKAQ